MGFITRYFLRISMIGKIWDEGVTGGSWIIAILTTSTLAVLASVYGLMGGITEVFPHLYYIPILLNAYRNPRTALVFAAFLGAIYTGLVCYFTEFAIDPLVKALIRVLVFIWVAAIISFLAGNLKHRNRYLSAMNEIITAASTSASLEEILSMSAKRIREILAADLVMVFLVDGGGKRASLHYREGIPEENLPPVDSLDLEKDSMRRILASGEPGVLDDVEIFDGASFPKITSYTIVPLLAGSQVLGIIAAGRAGRPPLPRGDMEMLGTVSRAVGSAVKKAHLQEELAEAYTRANLYLDIMSHDITNVNTVSLGYAQLLSEAVGEKGRDLLKRMEGAIRQSVEIIRNVSTIRRIQERSQELRAMDLDPVIRAEMDHEPDLTILYRETGARVCANTLLSEVFRNLIGNSAKFGGPKVRIWISVADEGDSVRISVEDDGPGIPDDLKPLIFNRFQKGKSTGSGKGLGLYICRMIIEGCGGRIEAGDRVDKDPGKGAAIRFTLRKACPGREGKNL